MPKQTYSKALSSCLGRTQFLVGRLMQWWVDYSQVFSQQYMLIKQHAAKIYKVVCSVNATCFQGLVGDAELYHDGKIGEGQGVKITTWAKVLQTVCIVHCGRLVSC
eukprot:TRINITY_DN29596_c0_g3_i1.p5 TRINITY_DN29596_c0_g3~~TRINITY_DN29596_c0_g3_i1.p5  ORF type:complete len:106 (-),score=8.97 TRINITY_DN29596_c0_g3_i1:10-327(-)